jgi:hydrogenase expression/formation protein HypC
MCLAVPGRIIGREEDPTAMARISFGGIVKEASLELVPSARVGDYVLVHVGVAISIVDEEEAEKTFEYLREIGELNELEGDKSS